MDVTDQTDAISQMELLGVIGLRPFNLDLSI
jgi:hypothetical protein